jgi:hypothetical protein
MLKFEASGAWKESKMADMVRWDQRREVETAAQAESKQPNEYYDEMMAAQVATFKIGSSNYGSNVDLDVAVTPGIKANWNHMERVAGARASELFKTFAFNSLKASCSTKGQNLWTNDTGDQCKFICNVLEQQDELDLFQKAMTEKGEARLGAELPDLNEATVDLYAGSEVKFKDPYFQI